MRVSFSWLREMARLPAEVTAAELADRLTRQVAEVDSCTDRAAGLEAVVAGRLTEVTAHPQADRLKVTTVDVGRGEELTVVFGKVLPLRVGQVVPVAVGPCTLPTGIEVRSGEVRGVPSQGMVCVDEELGLELGGRPLDDPKHPGEKIHLTQLPKGTPPGKPVADVLQLNDWSLAIDSVAITHRPDLWGHYGLAREAAALYGTKVKPPQLREAKPAGKAEVEVKLKTDRCWRYLAARLDGLSARRSPHWLRVRLESCGLRSLGVVVDVTNYVMLELGQPLHAFDASAVEGGKVVVREAEVGEKLITLDGVERQLPAGAVLICDSKSRPLAIGGIVGGQGSAVSPTTSSIILESATFDPRAIRHAAEELDVRTDASARFEKGLDPALAELAMRRAVTLLLQLCPGATLAGPIADVGERKAHRPVAVETSLGFIGRRLGLELTADEVAEALKPLGFGLRRGRQGSLTVEVPSWRAGGDVATPEDVVEEVGRRIGYGRIEPRLGPRPAQAPAAPAVQRLSRRLRELLAWRGRFTEVQTYSWALPSPLPQGEGIELINPPSSDAGRLRLTLLPNVVAALAKNLRTSAELALFELGRVFRLATGSHDVAPDSAENLPAQPRRLAAVLTAPGVDEATLLRQLKGTLEGCLAEVGYPAEWAPVAKPPDDAPWVEPAASASLSVGGELIGFISLLPQDLARTAKIGQPVALAEVDVSRLAKLKPQPRRYQPLPRFPQVVNDVAIIVPASVRWAQVEQLVFGFHPLIADVELFDVFTGGKVGEGRRSLAFHVTFGAPDRTLTGEEVQQVVGKLQAELVKRFQAEVR